MSDLRAQWKGQPWIAIQGLEERRPVCSDVTDTQDEVGCHLSLNFHAELVGERKEVGCHNCSSELIGITGRLGRSQSIPLRCSRR